MSALKALVTTVEQREDRHPADGWAYPVPVEGVGLGGSVAVPGLPQADDHARVVEALERFLVREADDEFPTRQ